MDMGPLSLYRNRYAGQRGILVGSGPTTYQYADLAGVSGPVGFVNDALLTVDKHTSDHFFTTHHQGLDRWSHSDAIHLRWAKAPGPVWVDYVPDPILPRNWIDVDFVLVPPDGTPPDKDWTLDREFCATNGQLCYGPGSITGLIHFFWFCGVADVLGIGINPKTVSAPDHDPRITAATGLKAGKNYNRDMQVIVKQQKIFFRRFGMRVEYWEDVHWTPSLPS